MHVCVWESVWEIYYMLGTCSWTNIDKLRNVGEREREREREREL